MTIYGGPDIITDGLVLHLDAGNSKSYPGSGTVWTDLSGNGNNGTLINGPSYSSSNKGNIVFDGSNDYVDCGNPSVVDFNGFKNMTISNWFYPTNNTASDANIVSKIWQWYTNFHTTRKVRFGFYTTSVNATVAYSNTVLNLNNWYNICWTYNGSSAILYINGLFDSFFAQTSTLSYGSNQNCNLLIGAEATFCTSFQTRYVAGGVSCVNIYNRALSATEVAQNYNALKGRYGL